MLTAILICAVVVLLVLFVSAKMAEEQAETRARINERLLWQEKERRRKDAEIAREVHEDESPISRARKLFKDGSDK